MNTECLPSVPSYSDLSFAQLVEQGWDAECEPLDGVMFASETGFDYESEDEAVGESESKHVDEIALQLDAGERQVVENELGGCHDVTAHGDEVLVQDIGACVAVAFSMLPLRPPEPFWKQGVWADIFGDGVFLKSSWMSGGLIGRQLSMLPTFEHSGIEDTEQRLKFRRTIKDGSTYADIVVHKTDMTWQEERESVLQGALKRWLVVCSYSHAKTLIRSQLDATTEELQKLTVLADVFRGRAPATLLKRVRALEKLCHHFGVGGFPPSEQSIYDFFNLERNKGAPPSRLKGFMEAINFCHHVLSMSELAIVVSSRRCMGTTTSDVPAVIKQAEPLRVDELKILHAKLLQGEPWDKVFAGSILFAVYARARWADLMHVDHIVIDKDQEMVVRFLEGHTSTHKTMRSAAFKHRFLPLTAPGLGVTTECWAETWLMSGKQLGIDLPPTHVVMPAPDENGGPCARPLTSTEASQWLRKLLTGTKEVNHERKVSIHSCKATCLSFCAKYGLDPMTRLQLGYHTGGDSGLRMVIHIPGTRLLSHCQS